MKTYTQYDFGNVLVSTIANCLYIVSESERTLFKIITIALDFV